MDASRIAQDQRDKKLEGLCDDTERNKAGMADLFDGCKTTMVSYLSIGCKQPIVSGVVQSCTWYVYIDHVQMGYALVTETALSD